jgi:hypothetical protein
MQDARAETEPKSEFWHMEIFDDPETLASFINHVNLGRDQLVSVQFHALAPTIQRIMLTCRLTAAQREARIQWQAVERVLHPGAVALATGGGH